MAGDVRSVRRPKHGLELNSIELAAVPSLDDLDVGGRSGRRTRQFGDDQSVIRQTDGLTDSDIFDADVVIGGDDVEQAIFASRHSDILRETELIQPGL